MSGSEIPFFEQIVTYGIGGVLAVTIFWFYVKREKEYKELTLNLLQEKTDQNKELIAIVKQNSEVIAKHTTVLEALHRRLDGELTHHRENDRFRNMEGH